jgi:FMN hydrolase / 5-amino-6-(5-phospho-D-ribitylamino)uracil phosphatase
MLNIRAIAFDLDNTLWDVGPVIARAELRMMTWLREHAPRITERVTVEEMRAAREQLARSEPHRAHDLVYLRVATLTRLALESGYEEVIATQAFEVFHQARNDVELFPDVAPALARLQRRYALATLSNGTADLSRIGLASFFSVRLGAREIGFAKPHPRCFERLTEDLGVAPGEILYVGDDPVLDVNAARKCGLRTAWMNRRGAVWPAADAPADVVVTECGALVTRLS